MGYKVVVIDLVAWKDTGQDIFFPFGFLDVPAVVGNTTGLTFTAGANLFVSKINMGDTHMSGASGVVVLIGP